jgi:hypothetical protein
MTHVYPKPITISFGKVGPRGKAGPPGTGGGTGGGGAVWGSISGNINNQADLAAALNPGNLAAYYQTKKVENGGTP